METAEFIPEVDMEIIDLDDIKPIPTCVKGISINRILARAYLRRR